MKITFDKITGIPQEHWPELLALAESYNLPKAGPLSAVAASTGVIGFPEDYEEGDLE